MKPQRKTSKRRTLPPPAAAHPPWKEFADALERNRFDIETARLDLATVKKELKAHTDRVNGTNAQNAAWRAEALIARAEEQLKRIEYITDRLTLDVTHNVLMLILGELARVRTPDTSPVIDSISAAIDKAAAETKAK